MRASRLKRASRRRPPYRDAQGGDRADQVEPAALPDEVVGLLGGCAQVKEEIDQEDDADHKVIELQQLEGGLR